MNVVALQLRRVGDILMTTPALGALKARFPQAEVTFVCERPFGTVLRSNPHVDTLLTIDPAGGWKDRLRLTATLRERAFDLALDFEGSGLTAAVTAASGATRRVGWGGRLRSAAYTDRVAVRGGAGYLAAQKLELLAPLGIEAPAAEARPTLVVEARSREWAARTLAAAGVASATFLLTVAPWARSRDRAWPLESYGRLVDLLTASHDVETVLLLGPGDEPLGEALGRHTSAEMFQLSTPATLPQMAALLDRADLHVGNENAARHMAVALGTASLTLFAPGGRRRWTLPGDPLQAGLEAAPHEAVGGASPVAASGAGALPEPLRKVTPEEAYAAVLALEPYLPRLRGCRRPASSGSSADGPGAERLHRKPSTGTPARQG